MSQLSGAEWIAWREGSKPPITLVDRTSVEGPLLLPAGAGQRETRFGW